MQTTPLELALFGLVLAGCAGQKLDIGDDAGGSGGSSGSKGSSDVCNSPPPGAEPASLPEPKSCESGTSPLQGTWTGYTRGNVRDLREQNIKLTLAGDDAALCGTVMFGDPQPLPSVDPNAAYPVGFALPGQYHLFPGFAYQVLKTEVSGKRLQIDFSAAEPYAAWCEAQTPYFDTNNPTTPGWYCDRNLSLEGLGGNRFVQQDSCTGARIEGDLFHHELCVTVEICSCYGGGCKASPTQTLSFDLNVDDDDAQGDLDGTPVFLTRDATADGDAAMGGAPPR